MTTMSHNEWAISFEPNAHGRISISHETRPGNINVDIEDLILASGFDVEIWDRGHQAIQSTCFARFVELNDMQHVLRKEDWAPMGLTTLTHQGWEVLFSSDEPNRLYVTHEDHPGSIHIKADDEGFVVDVWPDSHEQVLATCAALYSDLEGTGDEDEG